MSFRLTYFERDNNLEVGSVVSDTQFYQKAYKNYKHSFNESFKSTESFLREYIIMPYSCNLQVNSGISFLSSNYIIKLKEFS